MHQYRWNGLQSQIWMTAKIAELQRSVKVHREKSWTFSQKVSAKLSVLPQDATQPQPLQCPLGCLEVFNFSTRITLFSCLQLWTKNTKEVTLWVTSEVFTHVRARQKSVTCSKTQSQPRKTKCAPKVTRESVWLFPTASIFQTHQAVNLLYLKSIYIFSYLPPPSWYTLNNIVFKEPGGVTGAADCQPGSRGVSPLPLPRHAPCLQVGENS